MPDSAPAHDNSAKPLLSLGPRPPGTRNTEKTSTRFPFFFLFFFFWYKMIQTTIQNSCAVDDYKKSRDVCLTAQCSELQCEYIILQYLSPKQPQSCGAVTHFVHFQKETCKKKSEWKKERKGKEMRSNDTQSGPPAGRVSPSRTCLLCTTLRERFHRRLCAWETLFGFFWCCL